MSKIFMKRHAAYAMMLMLAIGGCAVGPNYKRPSMAMPVAYKEAPAQAKDFIGPMKPNAAANLTKATPLDNTTRGKWWEIFNDPALNALEEQVAANNQTVKAAEASFRQSRALVAEARATFFPTVSADGSITRSGSGKGSSKNTSSSTSTLINNGTTATTVSGSSATIGNNYSASLEASWMPDFWGRIRRQLESSKATAQAGAADLASAILSAQGELAIDYLALRIADEQKRILDRSVNDYGKSLQITQNQYKVGVAAASDVLQAKVQLETTQAQQVDIGVTRAQFEHAIAVLVGKAPADFTLPVVDNVPALPEIPAGIPSQLLQRRPDIAATERTVASANAQIGVAEAAFFPDITLSASGGYASTELYQWFTLPNRFWSIGPSLVETLFDAGLRAAQTEAAIATYDQAVANYRQTVLTAFQGVEDNLASLRILAQEAQVLDSAVVDAKKAVKIFINQYKAGTVSYLNVVTAQTAELNDEIAALNVRKARLTAAATLIEDLGGGWNARELKKPDVTQGEATPFSLFPPRVKKQ